jgi:hypothetical protein
MLLESSSQIRRDIEAKQEQKKVYSTDSKGNYIADMHEKVELDHLKQNQDNLQQLMVTSLTEFSQIKKEMDEIIFHEKELPKQMQYELKFSIQNIDENVNELKNKVMEQQKLV